MRWKIGTYEVKYNPKSNSKSWGAEQDIITNVNGNSSNPNLVFNGTQNFTIDIYEKATYLSRTPILTGSYVSITEERITERIFMLKNNGTFDVKGKDGANYGNFTITKGTITALPSTFPISMIHIDTEIAFLYQESGQTSIVITDKNGVGNRKYIYTSASSGDMSTLVSLSWAYNSIIYAVNPYGRVYTLNTASGIYSFACEFEDFSTNKSGAIKKYKSSIVIEKQGNLYLGIMTNNKNILFLDGNFNIICQCETNMNNIIDISYSNYSEQYYVLIGTSIIEMFPNTCRIDVEIIKSIVSNGRVTITDENGVTSVLAIKGLNIARNKNMQEAKYEISFNADIMYTNQMFDSKWKTLSRIPF
jgi:hypothetical protein